MLSIGLEVPRDNRSFQEALARAVAALDLPAGAVTLEGEFPKLDSLVLNLTGARFPEKFAVPKPGDARERLCFVRSLRITAAPGYVRQIPVDLDVAGDDVVLATAAAEAGGERILLLEQAGGGKLRLGANREGLQAALLEIARGAVEQKGAEVKSLDLHVANETPRALAVRAELVAKAMLFTTTVTAHGCLEVDDQLNARIRDLHCEGDGMIGKMAAGAVRPHIHRLQAQVFPLGRAAGGIRLHDLRLHGGERVEVEGTFGAV